MTLTEPTAVTVFGDLPAMPLVVVESSFMGDLLLIEGHVSDLSIKDAKGAQQAATLLASLTQAGTKLEAARKAVKEPFLQKCREIDEAPKPVATRIEKAKILLRQKLTAHQEAEQKKAAELERQRQVEIARLQKLKDEEDTRLRKEAEELEKQIAANQKANVELVDEPDFEMEPPPKTEVEIQLEKAKFTPAVVAPKTVGIAFRCTLRIKSVQVNGLPDHFVLKTADERAIRGAFCSGWQEGHPLPSCPGVVFEVEKTPVSTGRSTF